MIRTLFRLTLVSVLLCDSLALLAMRPSQAPAFGSVQPTLPALSAQAPISAPRGFNLNQKLDSANKALTFVSHGLLIGGGLYLGYKGIQVLRKLAGNDTQERLQHIEEQQGIHGQQLEEVNDGVQTGIAKIRSLRTFTKNRFAQVQNTQVQHTDQLTNIQNTQATQGRAFFGMFRGLWRGQRQLQTTVSKVNEDVAAIRADQKAKFEEMAAQLALLQSQHKQLAEQNATMQGQLNGIASDSRETVEFVRGIRSGAIRNFPSNGLGRGSGGLLTAANVWAHFPRTSTSLALDKPKAIKADGKSGAKNQDDEE